MGGFPPKLTNRWFFPSVDQKESLNFKYSTTLELGEGEGGDKEVPKTVICFHDFYLNVSIYFVENCRSFNAIAKHNTACGNINILWCLESLEPLLT